MNRLRTCPLRPLSHHVDNNKRHDTECAEYKCSNTKVTTISVFVSCLTKSQAPNPGPLHELADLGASIASADGERSNKVNVPNLSLPLSLINNLTARVACQFRYRDDNSRRWSQPCPRTIQTSAGISGDSRVGNCCRRNKQYCGRTPCISVCRP
jgi:hypothetical protein